MSAAPALDDGVGANTGLGLLLLGTLVLAATSWAAVDGVRAGRRAAAPAPLLGRWALVVVLVGVAQAVQVSVAGAPSGGGSSLSVLASDLLALAPFEAVLLGVPATVALAVGRAVSLPSSPPGGAAPAR